MAEIVKWLVGVDWAKKTHQVCLLKASGKILGEKAFPHDGAGLAALCDWLLEKTGGTAEEIAVLIEVPHGPVVETLMERQFPVYAINPKQLDRFRDRFSVAGAKDDRRDARVMADALRTDRDRLRQLRASDPIAIALREWSRMGTELQQEQTRLSNRIQDHLWRYYPQALELTDDVSAGWFLELWALAPTPAKAARISEKSVARVLAKHRVRRINAAEVLRILKEEPIRVAAGTTEAVTAHIRTLVVRVTLVNQQIRDVERNLDILCDKFGEPGEDQADRPKPQRDATILRSLPGIGRIVVTTLLSEAAEPLHRRDYHALRPLCGVAPVTKRSGKSLVVVMRYACHLRLRNAVYNWARVACQHDETCKQRYDALRQRGATHGRAIRQVGDRLLKVACAMLKAGTLFDPNHQGSHSRTLGKEAALSSA